MLKLKSRNLVWLPLVLALIALDLWTKSLATAHLDYGVPVEILPVFNLTLQHNSGAAFSFLSDAGGWQRWFFSGIAMVVGLFLLAWLLRLQAGQKTLACSLSLILAGALGNLWDRLELGYVVDFISVHYQSYYFPAFNIADSAITIGAILILLDMLIHPDNHAS
jgi:signal peptidase II